MTFAPLLAAALLAATVPHEDAPAADDQVTVLFDGTSLDAFEAYAGGEVGSAWVIEGDALHFLGRDGAKKGGGGDIQTKQTFGDFDLRFQWKVSEGANSGVMYGVESKKGRAPYFTGPEYQVLDDAKHRDGKNPKTSAGAFYALFAAAPIKPCPNDPGTVCPHQKKRLEPVGNWNDGRIVKVGDRVRHYLNGEKVVDVRLDSPEFAEAVENSKFKTWEAFAGPLKKGENGRFVLQDHGDSVWFRAITVREPTLTEDGPLLEG